MLLNLNHPLRTLCILKNKKPTSKSFGVGFLIILFFNGPI